METKSLDTNVVIPGRTLNAYRFTGVTITRDADDLARVFIEIQKGILVGKELTETTRDSATLQDVAGSIDADLKAVPPCTEATDYLKSAKSTPNKVHDACKLKGII